MSDLAFRAVVEQEIAAACAERDRQIADLRTEVERLRKSAILGANGVPLKPGRQCLVNTPQGMRRGVVTSLFAHDDTPTQVEIKIWPERSMMVAYPAFVYGHDPHAQAAGGK